MQQCRMALRHCIWRALMNAKLQWQCCSGMRLALASTPVSSYSHAHSETIYNMPCAHYRGFEQLTCQQHSRGLHDCKSAMAGGSTLHSIPFAGTGPILARGTMPGGSRSRRCRMWRRPPASAPCCKVRSWDLPQGVVQGIGCRKHIVFLFSWA